MAPRPWPEAMGEVVSGWEMAETGDDSAPLIQGNMAVDQA